MFLRQKNSIFIIFIFSLAFILRLGFVLNYDTPLGGDEPSYNRLALSIVEHARYYDVESYSRPPGYPFFIAVIYFIFGKSFIWVRIVQALLDSFSCALLYILMVRLFNVSMAKVTFFISSVWMVFISSSARFLAETLFTFLLVALIFYVYRTKERFTYLNMFMIGSLITLLIFVKGIMILFLPFLFFVLLVSRFYKGRSFQDIFKKMLVSIFAFIMVLGPWTYRNYRVYHAFIPVSTQSGYALYDCYFPKDGKIFGVNVMDGNVRYALSLNSQVEMSRYLTKKTIEFIRDNPFKVIKLEFLKVLYFWAPFDWEMMGEEKGVYNFQYMFILPFSLFGMILLLKKFSEYAPLYISLVYLLLMSLVFYGSPRFRMPIEPYLIIFFAFGILRFFEKFENKLVPTVITTSYFFLNFIMYLNSDLVKSFFRGGAELIGIW